MQQQKVNSFSYSSGSQSYKIITQYGDMLVIKQGNNTSSGTHQQQHYNQIGNSSPSSQQAQQQQQQQQQQQTRPVIMTFHDLGLNSELQFASFCECDEVKLMLQTFTVLHVNFIGQEFDAERLPSDFKYPSVEQLAECIVDVCAHLRVRSFIGLAVGAGAHIASLLALQRPDLVDGLFLINPVVASCSITEWLYFKMSAIASNHTLSSHQNEHHPHPHHHHHKYHQTQVGSNSPTHDTSSNKQTPTGGGTGAGSLRRFINAASSHIHLPHSLHNNNASSSTTVADNNNTTSESTQQLAYNKQQQQGEQPVADSGRSSATPTTPAQNVETDTRSLTGSCASSLSLSSSASVQQNKPASGSRLRRLILSRNFRLGGHHRASSSGAGSGSSSSTTNFTSAELSSAPSAPLAQNTSMLDRKASAGSSGSSTGSQRSLASKGEGGISSSSGNLDRRAPYEYLMYHHFGPSTFQRYRRSSGCFHTPEGGGSSPARSGKSSSHELAGDCSSSLSKQQTAVDQLSRVRTNACSRSHESLASAGNSGVVGASSLGVTRARSGSLCMSSTYLASFSSERHKHAYMHSVYKHYFSRLCAHNLWLFAQSFAKRRALNLRKDCGAAAHAAAAAAALGTSICTAFVGISAAGNITEPGGTSSESPHTGGESMNLVSNEKQHSNSGQANADQQQQQQQRSNKALVAGTKVRRTFTCQTLIMCSSVQMHCERAFKLMSLLNPLQATWIKTDQLLVLEEKPEKVCQALRLFLQGIGYSMSTYERRLRLSSTTGSAGSNDSSGSMRSLNNERIYA